MNGSWYDNKALVVVLLFVLFPVGLYGMWKNKNFSNKEQLVVNGIIGILVILAVWSKLGGLRP